MTTRPQGYPLAALFLLIAAVAMLLAMFGIAYRDLSLLRKDEVLAASIGCSIVGQVVGFFSGLGQYRPVRATLLGWFIGGLFGALTGPLLIRGPHPAAAAVAAVVLLGSGVLLRKDAPR